MALKLPSKSLPQQSATAPPQRPGKLRPLAVRSGDVLALKMVRSRRVPIPEDARKTTATAAPEEFSRNR
jgi:hypothetical protein